MSESMLMINIVPVFEGREDFAISEIRRQARETGLRRFAVSLSFHPEGTPARDGIARLTASFRAVREGLAGAGVEAGVLIQSTFGHGWSGKVPLTDEPWQRIVSLDGTASQRMCPLDPDFRGYVRECVRAVMAERPAFLIIDDDFGLRDNECFCPLHVAAYDEALGEALSAEDYRRMIGGRPWDDPDVRKVSRLRRDTVLSLAKEIRAEIDAADPTVRCGYCTPWSGHGFVQDFALALAGGTRPFVRVNNATYCQTTPLAFYEIVGRTCRVRHQMPAVEDVIDESDTFPHNYYSESAAMFHTHVTLAFLDGLSGCKLWTSEMDNPVDTGSQRDYERRLRDYMPFYGEIMRSVAGIRWKGVAETLYRSERALHPSEHLKVHPSDDWNTLLGVFGFPLRYEAPSAEGVHALCLDEADYLSDDEIRTLLSGALLVGSRAAKALTARGFEGLMGVRATGGGEDFSFQGDLDVETGLRSWMMWEEDMALLEPVADGVVSAAEFTRSSPRAGETETVAPSMTFFRNGLGGRVVVAGWSPVMAFHKTVRPQRRRTLQRALDFLEGAPFEMGVETGRQFLVRHGVMKDGAELVAMTNLSCDAFDGIPLRVVREPAAVERLAPSGEWDPLPWRRASPGQIVLDARAVICEPVVCRFRF